jgi:cobalt/nickel transport protein
LDGKPLAGAEVEVEFYNREGEIHPPAGPFITQVVRADDNGVFTYAMPWAGWWGFAALATAENKLPKDGQPKPVEIGGVLWVHAEAPR